MKIYLDDVRQLPDDKQDWVLVRSAKLAIGFLQHENVTHISLDHDLGCNDTTGYTVIEWIEQMVHIHGYCPPVEMYCHSANPVGYKRIMDGISEIKRFIESNCERGK